MFQPETEHAADAAEDAAEGFSAGEVIIEHVDHFANKLKRPKLKVSSSAR